ncbi:MAG: HAD family hydrolase [Pseudomonadota bacterium]
MFGIDLVIFDCDGVLIDSEHLACAVDAELLTGIGYPMTGEDVASRFAGVPSGAMYAEIEADLGHPLPAGFADRVKSRVMDLYHTELQAIAGVAEALAALDLPCCVASSSEPAKLALGLIETGLYSRLYPAIYSAALVQRGKPQPDLFLYAARQHQAEPRRCVVVEDSVAGVTAGVAAGMAVIGFTAGSHCPPDHADALRQAGARQIMTDFSDLISMLDAAASAPDRS